MKVNNTAKVKVTEELGKHQYVIQTEKGWYFQSYNSLVAFLPVNAGPVQLDRETWNYSRTTGKYRNIFLGEEKPETEKKIQTGEYLLMDLNY